MIRESSEDKGVAGEDVGEKKKILWDRNGLLDNAVRRRKTELNFMITDSPCPQSQF